MREYLSIKIHVSGSDHNMVVKPGTKEELKECVSFSLVRLGPWPPPDLQSQANPDLNPARAECPELIYQSAKRPRFIEIHVFN